MGIRVITPPAVEPVTLDEAKLHAKVDLSDDDALFTILISSARAHGEGITRRAFVEQTVELTLDHFPGGYVVNTSNGVYPGYPQILVNPQRRVYSRQAIELPRPPLQSVTSVKYTDINGVVQTLDPSLYSVINTSDTNPPTIVPIFGTVWPVAQNIPNAVVIQYVVGWPLDEDELPTTPQSIRAWMLVRIAGLHAQRENFVVGMARKGLIPMNRDFCDALLDAYTVLEVA